MRLRLLFLAGLAALAAGCAKLTLAWADLDGRGPPARPALFDGAPPDIERWESEEAPRLRALLQAHIYGFMPEKSAARLVSRRIVDPAAFDGAGVLEEYEVVASATFGGETRDSAPFYVDVLLPAGADGPVPAIVMETFCPRWDTIPHPGLARPDGAGACGDGSLFAGAMTYVFGRYIATPPIDEILARGYAVAAIYPGEAIPDSRAPGIAALEALAAGHDAPATRWGAIAAWAWMYSRVADILEADERIDRDGLVAWGHSRYAKAALVAAAFDPRIDAVIAHQSGTGGAALNRGKMGETVREIADRYPHWFAPAYAAYAGREDEMPVDQHHLLALIAPRPVFLGNARRDVWSDPGGTFRAAKGASPAYALYGARGLDQDRLVPYRPDADIAFWIRPGTHGIVKEDWPAFLDFLDAHFGAKDERKTVAGARRGP
ncbi:glucuronyl esterase domain-containing protein [Amphiplicatus metriothermophilus]|uniref:4-O-methyl-glucuronoyl methylesterase-like domain-containing protein n=1 Tax=Amphiplicatus metriothermophilus TaxID=1519374 RepID=A0A239PK21_9PROT|nr:hypothetical protein [Amphiplicatus metriothermophilus]MBB5517519.1 hypothetical protein [Amphiplicatus metriothermophilus]SNT68146.1 hypothetical protein SAMN06297382_0642 [Amphiplicatus metriothermophilus]